MPTEIFRSRFGKCLIILFNFGQCHKVSHECYLISQIKFSPCTDGTSSWLPGELIVPSLFFSFVSLPALLCTQIDIERYKSESSTTMKERNTALHQRMSVVSLCTPNVSVDPYYPSLYKLPSELREAIWLETFEPRIIQLHSHNQYYKTFDHWIHSDRNLRLEEHHTTVHFTATIIDGTKRPVFYSSESDWKEANSMFKKPPAGPVALYVCHQSRMLALERYEQAFGGVGGNSLYFEMVDSPVEVEWRRRGLHEKKIWVDFDRDTILCDAPISVCVPLHPRS